MRRHAEIGGDIADGNFAVFDTYPVGGAVNSDRDARSTDGDPGSDEYANAGSDHATSADTDGQLRTGLCRTTDAGCDTHGLSNLGAYSDAGKVNARARVRTI